MPNFIEQIRAGIEEKTRKTEEEKLKREETERKARKEAATKQAQEQKAAAERALRVEAAWKVVEKEIPVFLGEINRTIFGGSARTEGWHKQTFQSIAYSLYYSHNGGSIDGNVSGSTNYKIKFDALYASLEIPSTQRTLIVFRPINVSSWAQHFSGFEPILPQLDTDRVWIGALNTAESGLSLAWYSTAEESFSPGRGGINLDTTNHAVLLEEVKNEIADEVVHLHPVEHR